MLVQLVFSWHSPWQPGRALGGKPDETGRAPQWWGSPGGFASQTCLHWATSNFSITIHASLHWHCFPTRVPALLSCDSLDLHVTLSNLEGRSSFCGTTFLTNLRTVDFSICSAFYLVLEQSGDFQSSYMLDWKLVVLKYRILLSANSFTSSFPGWMTSISFSCLIPLKRTTSINVKLQWWKWASLSHS